MVQGQSTMLTITRFKPSGISQSIRERHTKDEWEQTDHKPKTKVVWLNIGTCKDRPCRPKAKIKSKPLNYEYSNFRDIQIQGPLDLAGVPSGM